MKRLFVSRHIAISSEYSLPFMSMKQHENIGSIIFLESDFFDQGNSLLGELFQGNRKVYLELLIRLDKEYFQDINLDTAKSMTQIPHKRFYKEFREITGDTFANYMIRLRVYKVVYLLINSTIPVEQIAYDCGISSLSNYRKMVNKYCGMSPQEVRKMRNEQ